MNESAYELLRFYQQRAEAMSLKINKQREQIHEQELLINELLNRVAVLQSQSKY